MTFNEFIGTIGLNEDSEEIRSASNPAPSECFLFSVVRRGLCVTPIILFHQYSSPGSSGQCDIIEFEQQFLQWIVNVLNIPEDTANMQNLSILLNIVAKKQE